MIVAAIVLLKLEHKLRWRLLLVLVRGPLLLLIVGKGLTEN